MTFGKRAGKAMKHGGFQTGRSLARKLAEMLHEQGRLKKDAEIPEQTIQPARTRIKGGLSKYTLGIAKACGAGPCWLAFEIGPGPDASPPEIKQQQNKESTEMARLWSKMDSAQRVRVLDFAHGVLSGKDPGFSRDGAEGVHESAVKPSHRAVRGANPG